MASDWELKNRKENEDFRIQLFKHQEELLKQIDEEFFLRIKKKHDKLLRR